MFIPGRKEESTKAMSSPLFADDNPNRSRGDIMELIPESYKVMIMIIFHITLLVNDNLLN